MKQPPKGGVSTRLRASRRRRVVRRTTTALVPRVGFGPAGLRPSRITGGPPPNSVRVCYAALCLHTQLCGLCPTRVGFGARREPSRATTVRAGALLARCTRSLLTPSGRSGRACQVCRKRPAGALGSIVVAHAHNVCNPTGPLRPIAKRWAAANTAVCVGLRFKVATVGSNLGS